MKRNVKQLTRRNQGNSWPEVCLRLRRAITGWVNYYALADGRNHMIQSDLTEPPDADPHVRCCGRGGAERLPPIPIDGRFSEFLVDLKSKVASFCHQIR